MSGTTTQTMDISTITVATTWASNFGGMMYVDNPNQSLLAGDLSVTSASSSKSGGVFYFNQISVVTIQKVTTGSIFSQLSAPVLGSFMCSVATTLNLAISGSTV